MIANTGTTILSSSRATSLGVYIMSPSWAIRRRKSFRLHMRQNTFPCILCRNVAVFVWVRPSNKYNLDCIRCDDTIYTDEMKRWNVDLVILRWQECVCVWVCVLGAVRMFANKKREHLSFAHHRSKRAPSPSWLLNEDNFVNYLHYERARSTDEKSLRVVSA